MPGCGGLVIIEGWGNCRPVRSRCCSAISRVRLGDRYGRALSDHRALLRAAFAAWRGREISTEGDSFFVVFESAGDAVACRLAAQLALAVHDWPGGDAVRVRMGLHSGEPTAHEDNYIGMDVHRAADRGDRAWRPGGAVRADACAGGPAAGRGVSAGPGFPPAEGHRRPLGLHHARSSSTCPVCVWNASGSYWVCPIWDRAAARSNLTGVRPTRWRDWSQAGHQLARLRVSAAALPGAGKAVRTGGPPPGPANLAARCPWCWMAQVHAGGSWLPRGGCGCDGRYADRGLCSGFGP